jgi:hypothetical protein
LIAACAAFSTTPPTIGSVELRGPRDHEVVEAYVGLDRDLGWDYVLDGP